jgi:hypothetical protein
VNRESHGLEPWDDVTMTTLTLIYHTATGLAENGHRLPPAEQLAWRTVAMRLQELAEQEQDWPTWFPPAGYAETVRALHGQLATMDMPAVALAARWVTAWLAEHGDQGDRADQTGRGRPRAPARTQAGPGRPELLLTGRRRSRRQTGLQVDPGWAVLLISSATLGSEGDSQRLVTISNALKLTCQADGRPWEWREVGYQFQARVGPPPTPEHPSAAQIAAELEHLANGLIPGPIPGWWSVSTVLGASTRHRP